MTENVPAVRQDTKPAVNLLKPIEDLDQAWRIATLLSQSTMVPDALRNKPGNALVVMMTGQELGLTWNQAVRMIYVANNGQPGLRGELLLVKLRQAGHDFTYTLDDQGCTFTLHRGHEAPSDEAAECTGGRHVVAEYLLEDAVTAGLCSIGEDGKARARSQNGKALPWEQYAKDMLFWRAAARAVRRGCPEVSYGFSVAGIDGLDGPAPVAEPSPVLQGKVEPAAPPETVSEVDAELADISSSAEAKQQPDCSDGYDPGINDTREEVLAVAPEFITGQEKPDTVPAAPAASPPAGTAGARTITQAFATLGCTDRDEKLHTCSVILRRWLGSSKDIRSTETAVILDTLDAMRTWALTHELDPHTHLLTEVERIRKLWQADEPAAFETEA